MKRFPAGSEWRKWDLHVHVPGTKLNCGYGKPGTEQDFDEFADILENSDVTVFGITDYFSANQSLNFIKYFNTKYPKSQKLLLTNVELRLNETVSQDLQTIDFHIIFSDSVSEIKITEFLAKLSTQITDVNGRQKACSELSGNDYNTATVTRDCIKNTFKETFGDKAEPTDYLIYLAPANNNGIRAESGKQRKANLADEIDKDIHAVFGKDNDNSTYFLKTNRYEDSSQSSKPKPVFGGCDAHNFNDLKDWLGKAIENEKTRQVITWVKADPTFAGLQQTLVEPRDRVSLSTLKPDSKEPYKVISRVTFDGSTDFPQELVFNPNLNTIIGSRSSGKSALLAHIAHVIDPVYTVDQQMLATTNLNESEVGPAAGRSWKSVEKTVCTVEWANGSTNGGQAIYIPQNWLYQISDNPKEVTEKIRPVLESHYPKFFREHQRLLGSIKTINEGIERTVSQWFGLADNIVALNTNLKQVGDKKSITESRDGIKKQIEELREANSLSAEDLHKYQTLVSDLETKRKRIDEIKSEAEQFADYISEPHPGKFAGIPETISVDTQISPDLNNLPESLSETIKALITASDSALVGKVQDAIIAYRSSIAKETETLSSEVVQLETDNKELLEKHKANTTLDELVKRQKSQQDSLDRIEKLEEQRKHLLNEQSESIEQIKSQITSRSTSLITLENSFKQEDRVLDKLTFGIAIDFSSDVVHRLSEPFRKNEAGTFLMKNNNNELIINITQAQASPADFLHDIFSKKQKLNQGKSQVDVARQILTATREIRFTATLDQDNIGGFSRSTMTPGKQALFALTLILGESTEQWPLLIDQPEDDLDSRSIYNDIVSFLVEQKKLRQIILVTHNANLVVGADAEEVLVANRQGDDRKNQNSQTFDYLTGALEYSHPEHQTANELDREGVREFAVEILDGGEEAFEKRRDKYKL